MDPLNQIKCNLKKHTMHDSLYSHNQRASIVATRMKADLSISFNALEKCRNIPHCFWSDATKCSLRLLTNVDDETQTFVQ